ncbi:MAG: hypothetical protein E5Y73_25185 [Mesorhizobium sp.]|uniref:hypothetical protein n=1 Tax=Mesorhizobium sp. TaxID=1871066 RepID=UPI00121ADB0E|nr:hypothetical protein [Mesorhizobium sp.]TIL87506.1 MAG: hypothetical protein E5Y73_25185 [Mesorhizobium sp.]
MAPLKQRRTTLQRSDSPLRRILLPFIQDERNCASLVQVLQLGFWHTPTNLGKLSSFRRILICFKHKLQQFWSLGWPIFEQSVTVRDKLAC